MIRLHDVEQGTEAWQELRRDLYTGSNAIKLLKFGAIDYALTEQSDFKGNYFTRRGHILEDEAVELYEAITGRRVSRIGFITNSRFPSCGYSPDGLDGQISASSVLELGATLLEVKCFNPDRHTAIAGGQIPPEIMAQIQFGLLICDLREARLILYNPDLPAEQALKIIVVKVNRNIQANFKRILRKGRVKV